MPAVPDTGSTVMAEENGMIIIEPIILSVVLVALLAAIIKKAARRV